MSSPGVRIRDSKGKVPAYHGERSGNTRTPRISSSLRTSSHACQRCGRGPHRRTTCTGHQRRTLVDIVDCEKPVRHARTTRVQVQPALVTPETSETLVARQMPEPLPGTAPSIEGSTIRGPAQRLRSALARARRTIDARPHWAARSSVGHGGGLRRTASRPSRCGLPRTRERHAIVAAELASPAMHVDETARSAWSGKIFRIHVYSRRHADRELPGSSNATRRAD